MNKNIQLAFNKKYARKTYSRGNLPENQTMMSINHNSF